MNNRVLNLLFLLFPLALAQNNNATMQNDCRIQQNNIKENCDCDFYRKSDCKPYYYNGEGASYKPNDGAWDKICADCCCIGK